MLFCLRCCMRTIVFCSACFFWLLADATAGAWGYGSFENDSALDWVENFYKSDPVSGVEMAISSVVRGKNYLNVEVCCYAIAASEALAAAHGKPGPGVPADVLSTAKKLPARKVGALLSDARVALDNILNNSELRELWEESSNYQKWRSTVLELRDRLKP